MDWKTEIIKYVVAGVIALALNDLRKWFGALLGMPAKFQKEIRRRIGEIEKYEQNHERKLLELNHEALMRHFANKTYPYDMPAVCKKRPPTPFPQLAAQLEKQLAEQQ